MMGRQQQIGKSFVEYAWTEMHAPDAELVAVKVIGDEKYVAVLELPTGHRRALKSRWGEVQEISMNAYDLEYRHVDDGFWRSAERLQHDMGTHSTYSAQTFGISSDEAAQAIGEAMESALQIAMRTYYEDEETFFDKSILEREFSIIVVPEMIKHEDAGATERNARLMITETFFTLWGFDNPLENDDIGPWIHYLVNDGFDRVVSWLEMYEDEKGS
jgi:hypothetical protein